VLAATEVGDTDDPVVVVVAAAVVVLAIVVVVVVVVVVVTATEVVVGGEVVGGGAAVTVTSTAGAPTTDVGNESWSMVPTSTLNGPLASIDVLSVAVRSAVSPANALVHVQVMRPAGPIGQVRLALVAMAETVADPVAPPSPITRSVTDAGRLVPEPVATNVAVTVAVPPAEWS